ncbi:gluconate transporter [Frankia sp. AgB1.9]|uniref:GntT/GntP/DsdX family permease n=1 Tax=unclassified Frankia TaxID=2632575 RepID=UPI001931309D|nr:MULTISPECIES: SLC13 family permease [unclassified Frankia]MBL7487722.1 gluconate transporter [Frankia sp. AgW1.1]MBL7548035.1 gluconate transporter [Frankia sp. AgB1.9]MBL7624111.1 gluconate transporter [Frankia sp. AgB1.8]
MNATLVAAGAAAHSSWTGHDTRLITVAALGIALIVALIVWAKLHPFLALILGSAFVGLASGVGLAGVIKNFETGVGSTLQEVGLLIALGAMLGKLLADSGGANRVIDTLLARASGAAIPWAMALVAVIIGLPMFFEIGLVLLLPVIVLVSQRSGLKLMRVAIPALAGLSALHGLVPPHPGPLLAISAVHADLGTTLALGVLVAIPTVVLCGPLFSLLAARWVPVDAPAVAGGVDTRSQATAGDRGSAADQTSTTAGPDETASDTAGQRPTPATDGEQSPSREPSFGVTLATILFPVALMLGKALADIIDADSKNPSQARVVFDFIGEPLAAMTLAVLLALVTFGYAVGFTGKTLSAKVGASVGPVAAVILIVGAGGGFKQSLIGAGVGDAVAQWANNAHISVLVLGYLIAVALRLATGSATVATVTAAGIVAPLATGLPATHAALLALAIGTGSLFLSHVNDAGFWLVKELFGLTVQQTLKTWSVMETLVSVVGFGFVSLLWAVT